MAGPRAPALADTTDSGYPIRPTVVSRNDIVAVEANSGAYGIHDGRAARRPTSPTVGAGSSTSLRDALLVALTVASGAADAISYLGLGKIFSAFMTGNIVFLGFGHAKIGETDVTAVVFALCAFAMGSYVGQRVTTWTAQVHEVWPRSATRLFVLVAFVGILAGSRPKTEMPRLVGVLVGLVTGAVAGGLLVLHARSYAPALPLVITVLMILTSELRRRR